MPTKDLADFKESFAAKIKAVAKTYPFRTFNDQGIEQNITHWRGLRGEVLTSLIAGAYGVVPKLSIHAQVEDGAVQSQDYTVKVIHELFSR